MFFLNVCFGFLELDF
uniref:Uncharacterized protein n=1 Tax=Anguilla anguilla TaxID=7936 RepID=A0A0E9U686_ANGAN